MKEQQKKSKAIIHLDMDAFYPSVEILENPELKGKPVIVGGSRERGVVSSASYEARKFGIHSAQPMAAAMRLCPHGIFLPVRMGRYKEVSQQVFRVFELFTPLVEPLSIDEAFLDVSGSIRLFGPPEDIAREIKRYVRELLGLTVSAGLAPSKFVAKIASDMDKPDGLTVVTEDQVNTFLEPLPITKIWGVGQRTRDALGRLGIGTIGQLSRFPVKVLESKFGEQGKRMHLLSLGIDDRDVVPEHDVKSIGHEDTLVQDILDTDTARKELLYLAGKVARRMRRHHVTGKTVTLKVKYNDFVQITRSMTLSQYTDDGLTLYAACCDLLNRTEVGKRPVRLLGISVSHLNHCVNPQEQISLFERAEAIRKRKQLNRALDSLHEKFGEKSVQPGRLL
jgi:DNA polymerase-4